MIDIKSAARALIDSRPGERTSTAELARRARRRHNRRLVGAAGAAIALAAAITVGAVLAETARPGQTVHVGTTKPATSGATGAHAEAARLLHAATLPSNAHRVTKAPVALLAAGVHGSCNRQVDVARFWVVRHESPLSVARFLEHHIPTGMTTGGTGIGTNPEPDTYTFFVYPKGQLKNLNELFFTITANGADSTAVRADGIGIPKKASCFIK